MLRANQNKYIILKYNNTNLYDSLHYAFSLYTKPILLHIVVKKNKLQHLFNILLPYIYHLKIYQSNTTYMQLLKVYIQMKYTNIHTTYEVTCNVQ